MEKQITGSCLCGTVKYQIRSPFRIFQYCHCSRCRKFTGSSQAANLFVPPEQFKWLKGEESVSRFELPESKYFATSFCKICGSSLPWLTKGGKNFVVTAGTLDIDPGIKPIQNVFWDSKATWFEDPCKLPKYRELPK
ncbi:MAG: GFA family protein [Desulfocapsaceae bacterium]